eukprot:CFRG2343T1
MDDTENVCVSSNETNGMFAPLPQKCLATSEEKPKMKEALSRNIKTELFISETLSTEAQRSVSPTSTDENVQEDREQENIDHLDIGDSNVERGEVKPAHVNGSSTETNMNELSTSISSTMPASSTSKQQNSQTKWKVKQESGELADFESLLHQYYTRFFPYKEYYAWLSYGDLTFGRYLGQREFSFTLKDDIYIRYQSFDSLKELMTAIQARNPYKIDIGAVYNAKPKDHKTVKSGNFKPMEKELVFDIDMTDYDDIRTCCSGAAICPQCWPFMSAAIAVMDMALEEDFGFKHRLWIYSGRRGVHCWVCDKEARTMDNEERGAVADYLTVVKGGDQQAKKVHITSPLHPSIARSLNLLNRYFKKVVLKNQKIFQFVDTAKAALAIIADQSISSSLLTEWKDEGMYGCGLDQPAETPPTDPSDITFGAYNGTVSLERWAQVEQAIGRGLQKNPRNYALKTSRDEIILQHTYPRLDVNVSKGINHLLKSPFCVHPKTGRICVPIDLNHLDTFNPFTVPTISDLIRNLDEWHSNNTSSAEDAMDEERTSNAHATSQSHAGLPEDREIKQEFNSQDGSQCSRGKPPTDFQKTSLMRYMTPFKKFLKGMNEEFAKEREARQQAEASAGEF